jgi:hypothetical protein
MKALTIVTVICTLTSLAQASSCPSATLSTYLNGGSPFTCTESSGLAAEFNQGILVPSYAGLSILSATNSSVDPTQINVVPGSAGFNFNGTFSATSGLLSAQSEVVHFLLDAGSQEIDSTNFALDNVTSSAGGLGLGTGLAVGQELLCLGGTFTSLPTGLVTTLTGALTGANAFGCTGAAVIGSVAVGSGLLTNITGILGLPDVSGLSNNVTIDLSADDPHQIDVIKLQALLSLTGGSVADTGFGNTYSLTSSSSTPEPGSSTLILAAGVLLAGNRYFGRLLGKMRRHRGDARG